MPCRKCEACYGSRWKYVPPGTRNNNEDRGHVSLDSKKVYLDRAATYHYMFVTWCLKDICKVNTVLREEFNMGVTTITLKGMLGLFDMWINKRVIANLLSIPKLEDDGYRVTCDTPTNWVVITPQGEHIMFNRDKGLCNRILYVEVQTFQENLALVNLDEHLTKTIKTVRRNFEGWTKREIQDAVSAREAQAMVGHPPDEKFKQLVSSKSLKNCRVKVNDITNARAIFGPYLPGLGGRTTRRKPGRVEPDYIGIPREIYEQKKM